MRKDSVTFWAWVVSISAHLIVLGALGVLKFSQSKASENIAQAANVKISQIKRAINSTQAISKPKIRQVSSNISKPVLSSLSEIDLNVDYKSDEQKNDIEYTVADFALGDQSIKDGFVEQKPLEFFGCPASERRICFLVDCSGSMKPVFARVKTKLSDSISMLRPDQYFNIIFFGNEKIYEFSSSQFNRATSEAKQRSLKFIESINPSGQTNAAIALKKAIIVSADDKMPAVIYFLTDAFELTEADQQQKLEELKGLLETQKQGIVINTIGFWSRPEDMKVLKMISQWTGGEYVFINDFNM